MNTWLWQRLRLIPCIPLSYRRGWTSTGTWILVQVHTVHRYIQECPSVPIYKGNQICTNSFSSNQYQASIGLCYQLHQYLLSRLDMLSRAVFNLNDRPPSNPPLTSRSKFVFLGQSLAISMFALGAQSSRNWSIR